MAPSTTPSPTTRLFFGKIFPIPFILVGAATLFFGLRDMNRARNSVEWPIAEGVVVESRVESQRGDKGGTTYRARIRYEYRVKNTMHSGDRVAFGDFSSSDSDRARQIVNRHPVGQKTAVRHSPDDASLAVIEPGMQGQAWFLPGFGAAFLTAGLAMSTFLPRALRKQANQDQARCEAPDTGLADLPVPDAHPKVTVSKGIGSTVFETRGSPLLGGILIVIAITQFSVGTGFFSKHAGFPLPIFLVADTLMLAGGAFLLFSRYTVTVASGKIGLRFGIADKGYRKEIALIAPISVSLEPRGTSKNGKTVDAIVVRNATGEEFHFGALLDEPRKQFLAGHLARLLKPKTTTPENPFE